MLFCSQVVTILIHAVLNTLIFLTILRYILTLLLHICDITRTYYIFSLLNNSLRMTEKDRNMYNSFLGIYISFLSHRLSLRMSSKEIKSDVVEYTWDEWAVREENLRKGIDDSSFRTVNKTKRTNLRLSKLLFIKRDGVFFK